MGIIFKLAMAVKALIDICEMFYTHWMDIDIISAYYFDLLFFSLKDSGFWLKFT